MFFLKLCLIIINYVFFNYFFRCCFFNLTQVSHHPPAAAHHVISDRGWTLRQEITVASKFRGKYLSIMPLGKSCIAATLMPSNKRNRM